MKNLFISLSAIYLTLMFSSCSRKANHNRLSELRDVHRITITSYVHDPNGVVTVELKTPKDISYFLNLFGESGSAGNENLVRQKKDMTITIYRNAEVLTVDADLSCCYSYNLDGKITTAQFSYGIGRYLSECVK